MAEDTVQTPDETPVTPIKRRRWLRRSAWIVGGTTVVLALIIFVLPSPLAQYLVGSQLNALGIQHEGLGTVDIDLRNRQFSAGPIEIRGDDGKPAKLGAVEATYSITNLFKRRAFVETFTLTGVDIHVTRLADGSFKVNGIRPDVDPDSPDNPDANADPFGYGVNTFVFANSNLILEDVGGGRLTLALHRLELADFRSWEPESAGRYDLNATLNGMKILAKGDATPFAKTIAVNGALAFDSLTLDGIAAFVGPVGLARQAGSHAMDIRHAVTLSPDGALMVKFDGSALTKNADLATDLGDTIIIAAIENTFDAEITLSADNVIDIGGEMSMQLRDLAVAGADGARVLLPEGGLTLSDMNLRKYATLREGEPEAVPAAETPAAGNAKPLTLVQLALRALTALGQEVLRYKLEGSATVAASASGAEATQPDGSRVALGKGEAKVGVIQAASLGQFWTLKAPLSASLARIESTTANGNAKIGHLTVDIGMLEGRTDFVDRSLAFDLALKLTELAAKQADGSASLSALAIQSNRVAFSGRVGAETLETALTLKADGLAAAKGGSSPSKAQIASMTLALDQLAYDNGVATAKLDGRLNITKAGAESGGAAINAASFGAAMRGFVATLQPSFSVSGGVNLSGSKIEAKEAKSGLLATLGLLEARTDELRFSETGIAFPGAIRLVDAKAKVDGATALSTSLASLNVSGLSVAIPKNGPAAISATSIDFKDAEAQATGETIGAASLGGVQAKNLSLEQPDDGVPSLKAGSIRFDNAKAQLDGAIKGNASFVGIETSGLAFAANGIGGQSISAASLKLMDATAQIEGDRPIIASLGDFDLADIMVTMQTAGLPAITVASAQMSNIKSDVTGETPLSASLGGIDASGLALEQGADDSMSVGVEAVQLTDAAAKLTGATPVEAILRSVTVAGFKLLQPLSGAPSVAIDTVLVDGLDGSATTAFFAKGDAKTSGGESADLGPSIRLGQLAIAPGGHFAISDASAGETLRLALEVKRFNVGPVDTSAPTNASNIDVELAVADKATLMVKGTAAPLAKNPTLELAADLSDFPLPLISPIVTKFTGLTVESGGLNVQAKGKTTDGALSGNADVRLAEFYVGEPTPETAAAFNKTFGVSPSFAVGLLKDGDGVITLTLPISGTSTEPSVDYGDVISKAIGGALASLFPSGAVKGEAGFGIESIPFDPGVPTLNAAGLEVVDKIAQVLTTKSDIRLRVCGKAARADLLSIRGLTATSTAPATPTTLQGATPSQAAQAEPLAQMLATTEVEATDPEAAALIALAQERASAVHTRLTIKGVAAKRIGDCRTSYSVTGTAPPRAEIQL